MGEVRVWCVATSGGWCSVEQTLRNWHFWQGRAGWQSFIMHDEGIEIDHFSSRYLKLDQLFADGYAKLCSGHSESAPVHISAASARRHGPTLAVELSRRDRERTDPRQLRQLRWRSARAGGFWWSSGFKVHPACRASFEVNVNNILCLIQNLFRFGLLVNSKFEFAKFDFLVMHICTGINIDRLNIFLTFIKDRGSQYYMRTGDVAAMQACQLQKVRDEQNGCKFPCVTSVVFRITRFTARGRVQYILCGRRLLLTDMQFFTHCTLCLGVGGGLQP